MKKWEKSSESYAKLTSKELGLIIRISNHMYESVTNFDYATAVRASLKYHEKKHFGIQLFLVANIVNFNFPQWYKPEQIKNRFETHMGPDLNTNKDKLKGSQLSNRTSTDSRDVNRALNVLRKKAGFKNITGIENIKRVVNWNIEFDGFPSIWNVGSNVNLVASILDKPQTFNIIFDSFLKSGLLYNYWRYTFLTILGCLEEVDDKDIKKSAQVFQNMFAAIPERVKKKPSLDDYIRRLVLLRNQIRKLSDSDLIKNAGKMAGFIIKNEPEFSIFGTHLERKKT